MARRRAWIAAAHRVLSLALPADEAEVVLGDLIEDAGRRPDVRVFTAACHIALHRAIARRRNRTASPHATATRLGSLTADLRSAARAISARPGFAAAIVTTLTLAIGASAAMFAVVDTVLLRPLPFADADRLAWITSVRPDNPDAPFTLPEFMDYRAATQSLSGLAAHTIWSASLAGDGVTERLQGARMSANAFEVLGLTAASGRLLQDADDRPDAARVVVISHRLWQQRFGGADVAGRVLRINAEPFVIAGVMPAGFTWPTRDIDVVSPLVPELDPLRHLRASVNFLRFFGRVRPGSTMAQAEQEMSAIAADLRRRFPVEYARKEAVRMRPLADAIIGDHRQSLTLLFASVLVVLGAALANLLCLVLVRSHDRRSEISIRVALGASRLRIARQIVMESIALSVAGAVGGAVIAVAAIATAPAWAPAAIPRLDDARVDGRTLTFVAAVTLAAIVLIAIAAMATLLRSRAQHALRPASRTTGGDRWHRRVRDLLVTGEIAAAMALLLATTMLVSEVARLQRVHPGFEPDPVFQARVSLPASYRSPADLARFVDRLTVRVATLPGVQHVGLISVAPLSGLLLTVPVTVEGQPPPDGRDKPSANLRAITPGYLEAAGTRLLRGRPFTDVDREGAVPVALVSAALSERMLAGAPIGRRLLIDDNNTGPRPVEIVGVVENVRQMTMTGPPAMDVYIALHQVHPDGASFVRNNQFWMVRSDGDPSSVTQPFITALQEIDRDAAISTVGTMRQYVNAWFAPLRFSLGLFVAFSLTAVLLSVSGLYGLIAYTVTQRRREIGLRMALGATSGVVRRSFLRHAAILGLAGVAAGLVVAKLARPLGSPSSADVAMDPRVVMGIAAFVLVVTLCAAWLPARRAARVAPTVALKMD